MSEKIFKRFLIIIFGFAVFLSVIQILSIPETLISTKFNTWLYLYSLDFVSIIYSGFLMALVLFQIYDFRESLNVQRKQLEIEIGQIEYSKSAHLFVEYKNKNLILHNFGNSTATNINIEFCFKYKVNIEDRTLTKFYPFIKIDSFETIDINSLYFHNNELDISYKILYFDNSRNTQKELYGQMQCFNTDSSPRF
ncbi:hypothetical protein N7603_04965 [Acholeplasma vituli]|uniref:Uncharacterized protein n=1 Tax=Paracholeplasma vituli TaxID=69473 RepID=A0ABT2PZ30_9MOLU|nr:hypothetical protein [Paracholeplasma vituli]MCU0105002.1 hypothetical protein [Paracholeplasma vituli]